MYSSSYSARIWSKLARIKGSSLGDSNKEYLDSLCQKSPLLDDAMLYLKGLYPMLITKIVWGKVRYLTSHIWFWYCINGKAGYI